MKFTLLKWFIYGKKSAVVCKFEIQRMELSRHFFAEAKYENRNLPQHLPRQLPSAEANYEGCYTHYYIQLLQYLLV